jgi:hypothetical protein
MIRSTILAVLLASFTAFAQALSKPTFEVASVKLVAPPFPSGSGPWIVYHGMFRVEISPVKGVIRWAYDVPPAGVFGGPLWVEREPYRFDAKAEAAEAEERRALAELGNKLPFPMIPPHLIPPHHSQIASPERCRNRLIGQVAFVTSFITSREIYATSDRSGGSCLSRSVLSFGC